MTKADAYLEYLTEEGYRPSLDADGDVRFTCDEVVYFAFAIEDDPTYFRVGVFSVHEFAPEATARALEAANAVNAQYKVLKVVIRPDLHNVNLFIELFLPDFETFKGIFRRALNVLRLGIREFGEEMRRPGELGLDPESKAPLN